MEYFDLFDSSNAPLNLIKERRKVHQDGDWHRTSQIWIINDKQELLCNLRSLNKDLFPDYWDLSIGGHVIAGDTYESTALREMEEELGIKIEEKELRFLSDEKVEGKDEEASLIDKEHARLFLFRTELGIDDFTIQVEEIQRIEYIPIKKLIQIVEKKDYKEYKIIPIKQHYLKILHQFKS